VGGGRGSDRYIGAKDPPPPSWAKEGGVGNYPPPPPEEPNSHPGTGWRNRSFFRHFLMFSKHEN